MEKRVPLFIELISTKDIKACIALKKIISILPSDLHKGTDVSVEGTSKALIDKRSYSEFTKNLKRLGVL